MRTSLARMAGLTLGLLFACGEPPLPSRADEGQGRAVERAAVPIAVGTGCPTEGPYGVSPCFIGSATATTLSLSPASAVYGGNATLSALLSANDAGLAGMAVAFSLNGTDAGTAVTDDGGVAALPSVSVAGLEPGVHAGAVGASFAATVDYLSSSTTQDLTVTKREQAISFGPLLDRTATSGAFTVSATGGDSGNPVTFSTASAACGVSGTTVTLLSGGSCALAADQAGDAHHNAAPRVTQAFNVTLAPQTLIFPPLVAFVWSGGSASLAAVSGSGLPVGYSVTSGPCALNGSVLTATGAGSCVVAANQAGNGVYAAAPTRSQTATVNKAPQTLTFGHLADRPISDGAFTVAATGGGSSTPVLFSTYSAACTLTGAVVNPVAVGLCAISADQQGSADYEAAPQVTQAFILTAALASTPGLQFQSLTFRPIAAFDWNGGSATLSAVASSGLPVTFTVSSGPCKVAGSLLTASSAGRCTVAAFQAGDNIYSASSRVEQSVTLLKHVPGGGCQASGSDGGLALLSLLLAGSRCRRKQVPEFTLLSFSRAITQPKWRMTTM